VALSPSGGELFRKVEDPPPPPVGEYPGTGVRVEKTGRGARLSLFVS